MKEEQKFYQWIRDKFPGDFTRIESTTGNGIPDIMLCLEGSYAWVECKVLPKGGKVLLRKEQYAWGIRHSKHGGRCCVVVRCDCGCKEIIVWHYPMIRAIPRGKYLEVQSNPAPMHIENTPLQAVALFSVIFAAKITFEYTNNN